MSYKGHKEVVFTDLDTGKQDVVVLGPNDFRVFCGGNRYVGSCTESELDDHSTWVHVLSLDY